MKLLYYQLILGAFFLTIKISNAQSIIVNNPSDPETNFTPEELLNNVLISGGCSLAELDIAQGNPDGISNISERSWGYFRRGSSSFPFENGIILSTGFAINAEGPNIDYLDNSDFGNNWNGDIDMELILNNLNGDNEPTENATFFQFKFTPEISSLSFDFIFASEEYEDQFECAPDVRDGFAFLIKGPGIPNTSGTAFGGSNIALVPGLSNIPVSTGTIRSNDISIYDACEGQVDGVDFRSDLYISNFDLNNTGVFAFDGYTDILTASINVIPGEEYSMKLVVTDRGDDGFDSAVFLRGSSFNLSEANLEITNTTPCNITIAENSMSYSGTETYEWFFNGATTAIPGETNSNITVNQSGRYQVVVTDEGCRFRDSIDIILNVPGAGVSNAIDLCNGDTPINLFDILEGTPDTGGMWSGPSMLSNNDLGLFDPSTNNSGVYTYTVGGSGSCPSDTATITVNIVLPTADAGENSTIDLCNSDSPVNLFDVLEGTPDTGGMWSGPSVLSNNDLGLFDPSTNNSGIYTYTVGDLGSCPSATATVTVNIVLHTADAGEISTIDLCNSDGPVNLFDVLEGTPDTGGIWSGPSVLSNNDLGLFDPSINNSGIYTYTVSGLGSCPSATATVAVSLDFNNDPNIVVSQSKLCHSNEDKQFIISNLSPFATYDISYDLDGVSQKKIGLTTNNSGVIIVNSLDFGIYSNISITNLDNCSFVFNDRFEIECFSIPEGISPNNDGLNDKLNLSTLNVIHLTIFNRYGTKVYEHHNNYKDEWHGTTNEGKKLPAGVYFYVIEIISENKPISGWIYLSR